MYLMCGPRQLFFLQCGPEMPKVWTLLIEQRPFVTTASEASMDISGNNNNGNIGNNSNNNYSNNNNSNYMKVYCVLAIILGAMYV